MVKIGQQNPDKKRQRINPVSKKRQKEQRLYYELTERLKEMAGFKSELNGDLPDYRGLHNHHISGRVGKLYLDPFSMIILTASQHDYETKHHSFERQQELRDFIRHIRLAQGFTEE